MTAQKTPEKQNLVAQEDIPRNKYILEINASRSKGETGSRFSMSGACWPAQERSALEKPSNSTQPAVTQGPDVKT